MNYTSFQSMTSFFRGGCNIQDFEEYVDQSILIAGRGYLTLRKFSPVIAPCSLTQYHKSDCIFHVH